MEDDADRRRDRAEQLDEIMAPAAIFGDDLSGPPRPSPREGRLSSPVRNPSPDPMTRRRRRRRRRRPARFDLDVALNDTDATEGVPFALVPGASSDSPPGGDLLPPVRLSVVLPTGTPALDPRLR